MLTVCILLPSGEGGDEKGGLEDLAGGNGMCGRGLREVGTGWRDCEVMGRERRHIKLHMEKMTLNEKLQEVMKLETKVILHN